MKIIICRLFTYLLWLASICLAAGPVRADDGEHGRLTFADSSHDFGQVYRGDKLNFRFPFTNTGNGDLTIQGVHAACGCTAVIIDKGKKYRPDESGMVEVTLDTTDFSGFLHKTVIVTSSERVTPERTLTVKAFVKSEVDVDPPLVDFGEVLGKDGAAKTIRIKPLPGQRVTVKDVVYNQAIFDLSKHAVNDEWQITVRLKPNLTPGFLKEQIVVKTTSVHLSEMPVPVRANIIGDIIIAPTFLQFGAIAANSSGRQSVTLEAREAFAIKGSRVELMINGKRVENGERFMTVSPPSGQDKQTVAVELRNLGGIAGSVHGKLFFQTSSAALPELMVDYYAFFR